MSDERYARFVEAFEVGTAELETEQLSKALTRLTFAIETLPGEPAAWANRGLLHLRNEEDREAAADLREAHRLAPESPEIESLLGHLAGRQGQFDQAVAHFRRTLEARPDDIQALYALAQAVDQQSLPGSVKDCQRLMEQGLKLRPTSYRLLHDGAKYAIRGSDRDALKDTLVRYRQLSAGWRGQKAGSARALLEELARGADGPLNDPLAGVVDELDAALKEQPGYQRSAQEVEPDTKQIGTPLWSFLRTPQRPRDFAPPDEALRFGPPTPVAVAPVASVAVGHWDSVWPVWLRRSESAVFVANASEARRADAEGPALPFPGSPRRVPPSPFGLLALDWDNDFRSDILLAGAGGLRFYHATPEGGFQDVTASTGLPEEVLKGDYFGAWAADYDADGDLDIVVAPRIGSAAVLRNNGDGSFKLVRPFEFVSVAQGAASGSLVRCLPGQPVEGAQAFAWVDLDDDGAADAAFVDSEGRLRVFANERMGQFRERPVPDGLGSFVALAAADVNDDGGFDLLALHRDLSVVRISDRDRGGGWKVAELTRWDEFPREPLRNAAPGEMRLFVADLDNNGAPDLVVSVSAPQINEKGADGKDTDRRNPGTRVWLGDGRGKFRPLAEPVAEPVYAGVDRDGDGRLDLLALGDVGQAVLSLLGRPIQLHNRGAKDYGWIQVWFEAAEKEERGDGQPLGDQRINSFAVGGAVEVRTGELVQKHPITRPQTHLGLGKAHQAHVLRMVWPNGNVQVECELSGRAHVPIVQRLSGSCPYLFADDGTGMRFVKDFLWSSPLGMYVNAQDKGGFLQTEDWVKVRGDQLAAKGGYYDLRVQANLWETHFVDHARLKLVDHPVGTEVHVDERFFLTPTKPKVYVTGPVRPVACAWDHRGDDVTDLVRATDGRYLDRAGRGPYQGITRDHWVEIDLGGDAPKAGPVYLLAYGFIHPTDSSINFAVAQGKHDPPHGLVLEVPDGKGGWKVGRDALGFPAGKNKTAVIRLDGIEGPGVSRRFRLRTNMEVYWDSLAYASGLDDGLARVRDLHPDTAQLRFHGTVEITRSDRSSPELPNYDKVVSTGQPWRDLEGYYTRYGDVRELLAKVDDRYAILNAGDEIAFRFRTPDGPPPGWKRDFVWVSDGWVKDGNLNTRFSKTVLPLPAHDPNAYDRQPGRLDDDPVYRRFPEDWKNFHTRYVTPAVFERGLRPFRRPRP